MADTDDATDPNPTGATVEFALSDLRVEAQRGLAPREQRPLVAPWRHARTCGLRLSGARQPLLLHRPGRSGSTAGGRRTCCLRSRREAPDDGLTRAHRIGSRCEGAQLSTAAVQPRSFDYTWSAGSVVYAFTNAATRHNRVRGCCWRSAFAIMISSGGRAPAWLETGSAPPSSGPLSIPAISTRNQ
jgi:hypothetical protein